MFKSDCACDVFFIYKVHGSMNIDSTNLISIIMTDTVRVV